MRQKLLFVWHIFIFNFIKPLPGSSEYFDHYFPLPAQIFTVDDSYYKKIVKFGKEQFGETGVLLANTALMFSVYQFAFWLI